MTRTVACISLALLLAAPPSFADPKLKGVLRKESKELQKDHKDLKQVTSLATAAISAGDARKIAVSHGATGYKPLPPGIRKNLARGKPIPPGIARTRLPGAVIGDLPFQDGYEWRAAGTDLLLVQLGTLLVADVLKDVLR